MNFFAVIDTNVLVSALLSKKPDTATVLVMSKVYDGTIVPVFNDEILAEYSEVLHRGKFNFYEGDIFEMIAAIKEIGVNVCELFEGDVFLPDPKDVVFYRVALSVKDTKLITGNTKHFPINSIVVTPAEMLLLIDKVCR